MGFGNGSSEPGIFDTRCYVAIGIERRELRGAAATAYYSLHAMRSGSGFRSYMIIGRFYHLKVTRGIRGTGKER
jgi:hypothetical protein